MSLRTEAAERDYAYWIGTALTDTRRWERESSVSGQSMYLNLVVTDLTRALVAANRLNDRKRRAYCMANLGRARALLKNLTKTMERSAA